MSTITANGAAQPGSGGSPPPANGAGDTVADAAGGVELIPRGTGLRRLNYFDGKFLRADDLRLEQDYLRSLVWLSNRAGGSGVVYGLDVAESGGTGLEVAPGLAIDPRGRVLYLPEGVKVGIAKLRDASRGAAPGGAAAAAGAPGFAGCEPDGAEPDGPAVTTTDLYLIAAFHAEVRCGQEDVYGKLCQDACVTSVSSPYRLEGIVLRAIPLDLERACCTSTRLTDVHRRSQVASAYFARERRLLGRGMSGPWIREGPWCTGAPPEAGGGVPLAVVALNGDAVEFLDAWTARREHMADPALRAWQWRTGMRPLAVFWAQVLQFQCQLARVLAARSAPGRRAEPFAAQYALLQKTRALLSELQGGALAQAPSFEAGEEGALAEGWGVPDFGGRLAELHGDVQSALRDIELGGADRVLIDGGITELPPAGWLPVAPGPVEPQVRRLLGEGVELRFCSVRADYVPHAFEAAQHLDRICLLDGLADAGRRPEVDVLVPGGMVEETPSAPPGHYFETTLAIDLIAAALAFRGGGEERGTQGTSGAEVSFRGAGRGEATTGGGGAFHFAGLGTGAASPHPDAPAKERPIVVDETATGHDGGSRSDQVVAVLGAIFGAGVAESDRSVWVSLRAEADPFSLARGASTLVRGELLVAGDTGEDGVKAVHAMIRGDLTCSSRSAAGFSMNALLYFSISVRASEVEGALQADATLTALLRREPGVAGGGKLVVSEVKLAGFDPTVPGLAVEWSGGGGRIEAEQRIAVEDAAVPIEQATLVENPDVALAGNAYHTDSIDALDLLRGSPELAELRAHARRLLFPPLPSAPGERSIRATADWVLFHRRPRSSCDCCPPRLAAPARRYVVWHAPERPAENTQATIRDVISGKLEIPAGGEHFVERLDRVAIFRGGGADLATPPEDVLQAWRNANPGETLVYGAITGAGTAAADADELLAARLRNLVDVVGARTPAANAELVVLPQVADLFDDAGADGVIVLVTRTGPKLKHRVFVASSDAKRRALLARMAGDGVGTADQLATFGVLFGQVEFKQEDATVPSGAPPAPPHPLKPRDQVVVVSRGMADPLHEEQAQAIAQKLGVQVEPSLVAELRPGAGNEGVFGDAVAFTIFVKG